MFSLILVILNMNLVSYASDVGGKSEIRDLTKTSDPISWKRELMEEKREVASRPAKILRPREQGNLPSFLLRNGESTSARESDPIKFPEIRGVNRSGMKIGDIFECLISQDIVGYVGAISPIKAEILSGPHKGSIFLGNATLDPQTKNIFIQFSHIRDDKNNRIHELKATVHSVTGQLGLKGTHHSNYWQYFFANLLARGAEGYANAVIDQRRNIFGTYQRVPSPDTAGKVAVAEAASGTADLLQEKMRTLPEYTTVEGPVETKIFIMETPKLTNL